MSMIFKAKPVESIQPANNLPNDKGKKESWTNGEKFGMIFRREMEVINGAKDTGHTSRGTVIHSDSDGTVLRREDSE